MIRRWLSRALQAGLMAAFVLSVYLLGVVAAGAVLGSGDRPHLGLSIISTTMVAITFRPLSRPAGRLASRLVYGDRAEPYDLLADFSHRVADSTPVDQLLPRIAEILGRGTAASSAYVWLKEGIDLIPSAVWPEGSLVPQAIAAANDELPARIDDIDAISLVVDRGELLGALGLKARSRGSPAPADQRILVDMASQVGLLLRNARLQAELEARVAEVGLRAEDLRSSRRRIVEAHDAERRALERNIHDGAQQFLVGLGIKLSLSKILVRRDDKRSSQALEDNRALVSQARASLLELSRGLYPRELTEGGVGAAILSTTSSMPFPVEIEAESGRYAPEVEAAVYFACIEAIQNAAKHAHPSRVSLRIERVGEDLEFEVADDGAGFEFQEMKGSGLRNLGDRVSALGGSLVIESSPGRGTRVNGTIPIPSEGQSG